MNKARWEIKGKKQEVFSTQGLLEILLENRNIENTEDFLNPSISKIPSFEKLHDVKKASEKILMAVKEKKTIVIYGDYDVDGISGTCLLWTFLYFELSEFLNLEKKDLKILPYIPDRVEEGYGLSIQSLDVLVEKGVDLVVTVDCGIRDKELIKKYKEEHNIDFVVTDHHLPPEDILDDLTYPIVHQLYPNKEYPYSNVCGAFVAFLLLLGIKNLVGMEASFEKNKQYLDLVALPTVTDIMPLHGVNRIVVKHGLETIAQGERVGIKELVQRAKVDLEKISTYHLGYILGPRINASGRIGCAMDGLKLLATKDISQAQELASKLDSLNFERQELTRDILSKARLKLDDKKLIFVSGKDWNEGIIGLVASKLQEEFHRPVIVVSETEKEAKGSARSINGFNITQAIENSSEFLIKYGGHEQAAGFSVKEGLLDDFKESIVGFVEENLDEKSLQRILEIDMLLNIENIGLELAQSISKLEPFGYGNRRPVFLLEKTVVVSKRIMGKEANHMKIEIKGKGSEIIEAIMFDCAEDIQKINQDDVLDIVGCIGINEWNGNVKVQFEVRDWRPCN